MKSLKHATSLSSSKENISLVAESKIFNIRNCQVMLDRDLAALYGVEVRRLNEQVKRNRERFPEDFMFQLTVEEYSNLKNETINLKSQNATSNWGGSRKLPYVFTENGVAMLSSVLHSKLAIEVNIGIMRAFTAMRKYLGENALLNQRINSLEKNHVLLEERVSVTDKKIDKLFSKMEMQNADATQGIFFEGQIFDAYVFFEKILQSAKKEIVLIDNYIDLSILERFSKKRKGVNVKIWTNKKTKLSQLDVDVFNQQYPILELFFTNAIHDRFLIIDKEQIYHIGASIKDLGKKCFAFNKMENASVFIAEIMKEIKSL